MLHTFAKVPTPTTVRTVGVHIIGPSCIGGVPGTTAATACSGVAHITPTAASQLKSATKPTWPTYAGPSVNSSIGV